MLYPLSYEGDDLETPWSGKVSFGTFQFYVMLSPVPTPMLICNRHRIRHDHVEKEKERIE